MDKPSSKPLRNPFETLRGRGRGSSSVRTSTPIHSLSPSTTTPRDSRARAREAARAYFASHAISPRVAHKVGVGLDERGLTFPNGRRRPLFGSSPKFLNPKGKPLAAWWLREGEGPPIVCEGEGDALAVLSALRTIPKLTGLRGVPVISVPGTSYPAERLAAELAGRKQAFLIPDADDAGWGAAMRWSRALVDAKVRPVVVDLPRGSDAAGWLNAIPKEERGDLLGHLLADHEIAAPSLAAYRRGEMAGELRREIEALYAAGIAFLPIERERRR